MRGQVCGCRQHGDRRWRRGRRGRRVWRAQARRRPVPQTSMTGPAAQHRGRGSCVSRRRRRALRSAPTTRRCRSLCQGCRVRSGFCAQPRRRRRRRWRRNRPRPRLAATVAPRARRARRAVAEAGSGSGSDGDGGGSAAG
eukprot:2773014-Prymnesium_polylepis.1